MRNRILHVLVCLLAASQFGFSGEKNSIPVYVIHAERHDVSPELRKIPVKPRSAVVKIPGKIERLPFEQFTTLPAQKEGIDPVAQLTNGPLAIPSPSVNFEGIGQGIAGYFVSGAPPDTNGDVGPNHFVQTVNSDYAVFNKAGALLFGPIALNTLWDGFGGECENTNRGDPVVQYDNAADRWFITQFAFNVSGGDPAAPFAQCIAVSTSADPLGSYNRYSFTFADFNDYGKFGVWPDAYYGTFNMFSGSTQAFLGSKVCAFDRTKMLAGQAATAVCGDTGISFGGLLPSDLNGATAPPAGSPNYLAAIGNNVVQIFEFLPNFTNQTASFTGPVNLPTTFTRACGGGTCIPQPGTTNQLDSLADRLMANVVYRNFGSHESLVVTHAVAVSGISGVRWYEVRSPGSSPAIFQQGTFAPDSNHRWMSSAAMDKQGNIAAGYSVSSSIVSPSIRYTGRLATDPLGTLPQGENTIVAGSGSQINNITRWGDYSSMSIDPSDDCTFWYSTQYLSANGSFNWRTRIAAFRFDACSQPAQGSLLFSSATASVLENDPTAFLTVNRVNGAAGDVSVSYSATGGTATSGSDFNLPPGSVSFSDGESGSKAVSVNIVDNSESEAPETVVISLNTPTGGANIGAPGSTTLTILDDDGFYSEDFNNGTAPGWTLKQPADFNTTSGDLAGSTFKKATATSPSFGGCSICTVWGQVNIPTAGAAVSLFGWLNGKDSVEVRIFEGQDKILLKQKKSGLTRKGKVLMPINTNQNYVVRVQFDGTSFILFVDSIQKLTVPAIALPFGIVQFRVKSTTGAFSSGILRSISVY